MVNKYKSGDEATYRVVGFTTDEEFTRRLKAGEPHPELEFLAGPYANAGVAKGQCTAARHTQQMMLEKYAVNPEFERIIVQVSYPAWEELEH